MFDQECFVRARDDFVARVDFWREFDLEDVSNGRVLDAGFDCVLSRQWLVEHFFVDVDVCGSCDACVDVVEVDVRPVVQPDFYGVACSADLWCAAYIDEAELDGITPYFDFFYALCEFCALFDVVFPPAHDEGAESYGECYEKYGCD